MHVFMVLKSQQYIWNSALLNSVWDAELDSIPVITKRKRYTLLLHVLKLLSLRIVRQSCNFTWHLRSTYIDKKKKKKEEEEESSTFIIGK